MSVTHVVTSAARVATGQGTKFYPVGDIDVDLQVTAASGTNPTLDITVEWSNNGTVWYSADPADAFTQLTTTGNRVKHFVGKGVAARIVWTITGTNPSFTFLVDVHAYPSSTP